jgi:hypothetical protein
MARFLIDECLHTSLLKLAHEAGHIADHVIRNSPCPPFNMAVHLGAGVCPLAPELSPVLNASWQIISVYRRNSATSSGILEALNRPARKSLAWRC